MIAFVFPGQGSQYVGMGKELAERYSSAAAVYEQADDLLGFSLSRLCFEGPVDELVQNDVVQPAILVTSLAVNAALSVEGVHPDLVAGLSVGEYTALVVAGVLGFEDAVRLVRRRGSIMKQALPPGSGVMLAIIGLGREEVEMMCEEVSLIGIAEPCNYNCPGQVVVGGTTKAVEALEKMAGERGAKKVSRVAMSSPSHCSLLKDAAGLLAVELDKVDFQDSRIPVVSNLSARASRGAEEIKENLTQQLCHAVLWEDSMRKMEKMGVRNIIEVGPGHTLLGFIRKTLRGMAVNNVEDMKTMEETLEALGKKEVKIPS